MAEFIIRKVSFPPKSSHHSKSLELSTDKLGESLSAETLGALNRSTESTVNDELRKNTNSTRNAKQDGIVAGFGQTVVLEENTGVLESSQYRVPEKVPGKLTASTLGKGFLVLPCSVRTPGAIL